MAIDLRLPPDVVEHERDKARAAAVATARGIVARASEARDSVKGQIRWWGVPAMRRAARFDADSAKDAIIRMQTDAHLSKLSLAELLEEAESAYDSNELARGEAIRREALRRGDPDLEPILGEIVRFVDGVAVPGVEVRAALDSIEAEVFEAHQLLHEIEGKPRAITNEQMEAMSTEEYIDARRSGKMDNVVAAPRAA